MNFINALFNSNVNFVRLSLFTGLIASLPMGIIGSIVVVKRIGYIAGAISHSVLSGIGISIYLNYISGKEIINPFYGAVIASIVAGVIIAVTSIVLKERSDTIIGVIWAIGMATGLLFMHITPEYIDPMSYLFGNIQLTTINDLFIVLLLSIVIIFSTILFYNQILLVSYDSEFAKMRGLNVVFYEILTIILVSFTIVLMVNMVGIVLVIALFTLPAGIASIWSDKLWKMMIISSFLCMFIVTFGMFISFELSLPSGSFIIIFGGAMYFLSIVGKQISKKIRREN